MRVIAPTCEEIIPEIINLGDGVIGVEIGVWKGENIEAVLQRCPNIHKMYGIDPYLPYGNYLRFRDAEFLAPLRIEAIQKFSTIGQRVELIEKKSVVAAESFELESIDFVFIDGDHSFEAVYEDLHTWYKRLKPGGLFSGHDFHIQGVNDALLKFRRDLGMKSTFTVTPKNIWWWKKPNTVVIQDI